LGDEEIQAFSETQNKGCNIYREANDKPSEFVCALAQWNERRISLMGAV
jgi:hypothetical protein